MEGGGSGGGVGGSASSSPSILLCGGGRQRFEVELRPGETTIVSWKKLMKDANKAANNNNNNNNNNEDPNSINKGVDVSVNPAPIASSAAVNPALDSRIAPVSGDTVEKEAGDAPPGSRFNAVIEKIERLYMGKNSSDEEDLNDVPDDDEYDTADSFIDDTELDDYFQVDNSAIKHDGFFVNRGKLERMNVPTALPAEQPKKRRRKDSIKGDNGSNEGHMPNKHMKVNKTEKRKIVTLVDKNSITPSRSVTFQTNNEDSIYQNTVLALRTVVKKPSNSKNITDVSPPRGLNGDARATTKNIEKQKTEVLQPKKHGSKLSDGSQTHVPPNQKTSDKNADVTKSQGQLISSSEKSNQSVLPREKTVIHQPADIKASEITLHPKATNMVRKDGSSSKPKSTNLLLEKAIRDLEKTVAEVRPPSMEDPEADTSSQAVKRRMPPEIKQKLAKVARLAHAIHGKLSKELLNRLMSILGHLIQLRSLKRNLQNMVEMGLSAKEEKDGKVQQLKKEVDEMVKIRAPMMKPEVINQQAESSGDFQETSSKEKIKSRFVTDDALEDKICDLYDLYVDGLDEDANPQIRKLYAELADLWPKGCMDNHGIRRAICRAKDRRRELCRQKDQENMKRKNLLSSKTETVTVGAGSTGQVQPTPEKLITDSSAPLRSITKTIAACSAAPPPNSSTDMPKQEKLKGISNNQINTTGSENLVKKAKKKPDAELNDGHVRSEKSTLAHGKQTVSGLVKPATQPPITSAPTGPPPAQPAVSSSVDLV